MTQGERVKAVRKSLNLTLEKFGKKIGAKRNTMSAIETDRNSLTEQKAKSICREFNVNYDWLVNGEGEMFVNRPQTLFDELCEQFNCDEVDKKLIYEYLKLDASSRKIVKDYMSNVFGN